MCAHMGPVVPLLSVQGGDQALPQHQPDDLLRSLVAALQLTPGLLEESMDEVAGMSPL